MRKGQAAMEFLMTYGWAILVVIAAIGALAYFGILNPINFMPEICTGPTGLNCLDKASIQAGTTNGIVTFPIINNLGRQINITSITSTGTVDCTAMTQYNVTVGSVVKVVSGGHPATIQNEEKAIVTIKCSAPLNVGKVAPGFKLTYRFLDTKVDYQAPYAIKGRAV